MDKKKYHIYLDFLATSIIALSVILIIIIGFNHLKFPAPKVETIKIEYKIYAKDSIVKNLNKDRKKLDSVLNSLKGTSNKIQKQQLELIEQKSDDSFYAKFYTAIVAIILALAGFFGFKSISEIKTQAIEDAKKESTSIAGKISLKVAKKQSKKIAKEEFNITFNAEYRKAVFDEANLAMVTLLREEIGSLEERIAILERNGDGSGENNQDGGNEPEPIVPDNPVAGGEQMPENEPILEYNHLVEPENPFENE